MLIRLVTLGKTLAAINHNPLELSETHSDLAVESLRTERDKILTLVRAELDIELNTHDH
jgi:hypothetical protein